MNPESDKDYDVIIVGGGVVGITLALLLEHQPLRIALLDRADWDEPGAPLKGAEFDPRVSALTSASQACFEQIQVWPGIAARRYSPYGDMQVWDADGTGSIHFSAADLGETCLGSIVENSVLLAALRERVGRAGNVDILDRQTFAGLESATSPHGSAVSVTTEAGLQLRSRLLVAADGANSPIRQMAGFRTREWDYGHEAIVTTVKTENGHGQTAWQRFLGTGPLAFLPLLPTTDSAQQQYSSIVWSTLPEQAQGLMALDDEAFCRELGVAFEHRLGRVEHCARRFSFPLRQRHALDYVQPGIALIGDAAHTIHPLAGQGVNLGVLDAMALGRVLESGVQAGRSPGDLTLLRRYQRQRSGHNLSMMWLMEGFKHLFASEVLPVRWLRNMGMSRVDDMGVVKNRLARHAMGLE